MEEIIKSIRYDVKCRYNLLEEFKRHPQIIRQKTSAIAKTVCANLGIKINDEIKAELSFQIDIVKKILELHKGGLTAQKFTKKFIFKTKLNFVLHLNLKSISS